LGYAGAVYQGFRTSDEAQAAFTLGWAAGSINPSTADLPDDLRNLNLASQPPSTIMRSLPVASDNKCWYVVYKGRCPGVYPAW